MCTQTCCYATGSSVACASATLLALLLPRRLAALLLACVYNWRWCVWVNSPKCTKRQAAWYASGWQTAAKAAATRPPTRPPGHQPRPPGHPATRPPGHPATRPPGQHPDTQPPTTHPTTGHGQPASRPSGQPAIPTTRPATATATATATARPRPRTKKSNPLLNPPEMENLLGMFNVLGQTR